MRYIVEQGQTTGSKQNTVLSGHCAARRFTKLISGAHSNGGSGGRVGDLA